MTETESVKTVVRILKAAEAKVVKSGGTAEDFKQFLNAPSPNFIPQLIAAAVEDTQREMIEAMKAFLVKTSKKTEDGQGE